jgi:TfoX/Sxy family transcriptional regulator of competence genes
MSTINQAKPALIMAYNEKIAERVREAFSGLKNVEEKRMFRGVTFMLNGKMCVSVGDDEIMCRINPDIYEEVLEKKDCRPMKMKGRIYKGYILVGEESIKTKKELDYWIGLAVDFNKLAKSSKKGK